MAKFKEASEQKILLKQKEIVDVNRNIDQLQNSKKVALTKKVFLESNMRVK